MAENAQKFKTYPVVNGVVVPDSMSYRLIEGNYPYSVQNAINIDFSKKKGIGIVRDGTSQVGSNVTSSQSYGSYIFYNANTGQTVYLQAVKDGSVTKLYYNNGSGWALTNITSGPLKRYRFATMNNILYLADGTNNMRQSSDGITFSVGTNCLAQPVDDIIRRKNRLIASKGDTHYISGNITSGGVIDWNALDAGNFQLAPFDGGKSSGYCQIGRVLFLAKTNGMYRLDADSASVDPDNIFQVGAISREAFTSCQGKGFFWSGKQLYEMNENGIAPIDDVIETLFEGVQDRYNVFLGADEMNVWVSLGSLIIDKVLYENIVLKYNVVYNNYSIFNYPFTVEFFTKDTNTNILYAMGDGKFFKLLDETESTDIGSKIQYIMKYQDFTFGSYISDKTLTNKIGIYAKNAYNSQVIITNQNRKETQVIPLDRTLDFTVTEKLGNFGGKYFTIEWRGEREVNKLNPEMIEIEGEVVLESKVKNANVYR